MQRVASFPETLPGAGTLNRGRDRPREQRALFKPARAQGQHGPHGSDEEGPPGTDLGAGQVRGLPLGLVPTSRRGVLAPGGPDGCRTHAVPFEVWTPSAQGVSLGTQ